MAPRPNKPARRSRRRMPSAHKPAANPTKNEVSGCPARIVRAIATTTPQKARRAGHGLVSPGPCPRNPSKKYRTQGKRGGTCPRGEFSHRIKYPENPKVSPAKQAPIGRRPSLRANRYAPSPATNSRRKAASESAQSNARCPPSQSKKTSSRICGSKTPACGLPRAGAPT